MGIDVTRHDHGFRSPKYKLISLSKSRERGIQSFRARWTKSVFFLPFRYTLSLRYFPTKSSHILPLRARGRFAPLSTPSTTPSTTHKRAHQAPRSGNRKYIVISSSTDMFFGRLNSPQYILARSMASAATSAAYVNLYRVLMSQIR